MFFLFFVCVSVCRITRHYHRYKFSHYNNMDVPMGSRNENESLRYLQNLPKNNMKGNNETLRKTQYCRKKNYQQLCNVWSLKPFSRGHAVHSYTIHHGCDDDFFLFVQKKIMFSMRIRERLLKGYEKKYQKCKEHLERSTDLVFLLFCFNYIFFLLLLL